jgi:ABC-2 family transporter
MIWLTWRQARAQAMSVYGAIAALLVFLAISAAQLPAFDDLYLRRVKADGLADAVFMLASFAVLFLPAIIGIFWGAPLVAREVEAGTHRLAWTQSVSRTRWLAVKLAVTGATAAVVTGAVSLALTWWAGTLDRAINAGQQLDGPLGAARISPALFDTRGIAPIGYALFALALGVAVGLVVRRVVPAMAITLVLFAAVQILTPMFVREHLGATTLTVPITQQNMGGLMMAMPRGGGPPGPVRELTVNFDKPGAWIVSNVTVDSAGRVMNDLPSWFAGCVPKEVLSLPRARANPADSAACFARVAREGYTQRITFQPESRYWTLQAIETLIFLALAGLLTAGSFWWLRNRVT